MLASAIFIVRFVETFFKRYSKTCKLAQSYKKLLFRSVVTNLQPVKEFCVARKTI